MTLPGPDVTHRWQGRTLVDHHGEPLGTIEIIYLDKVTNQPEWALLEVGATGPDRTFVPLVSAGEEGDTVRVPSPRLWSRGRLRWRPTGSCPRSRSGSCTATTGFPTPGPTRQAASPPANPSPPNRPWRLANLSLLRSRCPPAHPMWLLGSPRCPLRSQPRPPKSRCQPAAVPCLRLRPPNRRRSPPPLLGQHSGASMSQSPRRL